jgi:predicted XRE-type DNA-binding protein
MTMKSANPHRGSDFEDFLKNEDWHDEVNTRAVKKQLAIQLARALEETGLTKTELAARMRTSRAAAARLMDPENHALNLATMSKAAQVLGKRLDIQLVENI